MTDEKGTDSRIELARNRVMDILPPVVGELYKHERLRVPLVEILVKLDAQGFLPLYNEGLQTLADEAEWQAMAASAAASVMAPGRARQALDLMADAWNQLQVSCLLED